MHLHGITRSGFAPLSRTGHFVEDSGFTLFNIAAQIFKDKRNIRVFLSESVQALFPGRADQRFYALPVGLEAPCFCADPDNLKGDLVFLFDFTQNFSTFPEPAEGGIFCVQKSVLRRSVP